MTIKWILWAHCMFHSCLPSFHLIPILNLINFRTTIEKLLEKGFKPQRTIVLAFGIDEERGGNVVRLFFQLLELMTTYPSCVGSQIDPRLSTCYLWRKWFRYAH